MFFLMVILLGLDSQVHLSAMYYTYSNPFVFYTNIDQTLVNSLHGLLKCEKGRLDRRGITTVFIVYTCIAYFTMHWSI